MAGLLHVLVYVACTLYVGCDAEIFDEALLACKDSMAPCINSLTTLSATMRDVVNSSWHNCKQSEQASLRLSFKNQMRCLVRGMRDSNRVVRADVRRLRLALQGQRSTCYVDYRGLSCAVPWRFALRSAQRILRRRRRRPRSEPMEIVT
ncbi:Uncharacterised protein g2098 [Pycnogonum litorale]